VPRFIFIHPTVWPQYTKVTERQDRQTDKTESDRANRLRNGRPPKKKTKNRKRPVIKSAELILSALLIKTKSHNKVYHKW